jgi:hypothetical protein
MLVLAGHVVNEAKQGSEQNPYFGQQFTGIGITSCLHKGLKRGFVHGKALGLA